MPVFFIVANFILAKTLGGLAIAPLVCWIFNLVSVYVTCDSAILFTIVQDAYCVLVIVRRIPNMEITTRPLPSWTSTAV